METEMKEMDEKQGENDKFITYIGDGWYLEKCAKGLPPLNRTKLSKKAQERHDLIKNKLFQSNMWCNDWKFSITLEHA